MLATWQENTLIQKETQIEGKIHYDRLKILTEELLTKLTSIFNASPKKISKELFLELSKCYTFICKYVRIIFFLIKQFGVGGYGFDLSDNKMFLKINTQNSSAWVLELTGEGKRKERTDKDESK